VAASVGLHATIVIATLLMSGLPVKLRPAAPAADRELRSLVFLAPAMPTSSGGGGGGGNQQPPPIRRAEGIGSDPATLRVRKPSPSVPIATPPPHAEESASALPSVLLDAKPLLSGSFEQGGLPAAVMPSGTSQGPGSGGGVGTGIGTGIGPGHGPGLGPGSGGGTGGGVYRAGGNVSAPRVIKEIRPRYTPEALRRKIQGTVVLEAVITTEGCPTQIRVVRSLDRGGLDEEAIAAAAQWRFEPGRLAGEPVDVLVTILLDFMVR
jgi:TonB family protein